MKIGSCSRKAWATNSKCIYPSVSQKRTHEPRELSGSVAQLTRAFSDATESYSSPIAGYAKKNAEKTCILLRLTDRYGKAEKGYNCIMIVQLFTASHA